MHTKQVYSIFDLHIEITLKRQTAGTNVAHAAD